MVAALSENISTIHINFVILYDIHDNMICPFWGLPLSVPNCIISFWILIPHKWLVAEPRVHHWSGQIKNDMIKYCFPRWYDIVYIFPLSSKMHHTFIPFWILSPHSYHFGYKVHIHGKWQSQEFVIEWAQRKKRWLLFFFKILYIYIYIYM